MTLSNSVRRFRTFLIALRFISWLTWGVFSFFETKYDPGPISIPELRKESISNIFKHSTEINICLQGSMANLNRNLLKSCCSSYSSGYGAAMGCLDVFRWMSLPGLWFCLGKFFWLHLHLFQLECSWTWEVASTGSPEVPWSTLIRELASWGWIFWGYTVLIG